MRRLVYLLPAAALLLRRHELHALWMDAFGGIAAWQWHAWGGGMLFTLLVTSAAVCGGVLLVNYIVYEVPANRRQRRQP